MKSLVSKQHTNDGGYHVMRLVNEANERLSQIGRYGKRAKIVAKKSSLSLQFSFKDSDGRPQKNPGLGGISVSPQGILEAERIAAMVTNQLTANQFNWDWFNSLIGKPASEQTKQLTCKEMVEQYKKHFFEQRKDNKSPEASWYKSCDSLEKTLCVLDKPLSLGSVRKVVESKENNSTARKRALEGLVGFLKYFDNNEYKSVIKNYKINNSPKKKKRNVPSDEKIADMYKNGFIPALRTPKRYLYRYSQWQFLYGLLATYGLRIHEAWNIANWDNPVTLRNGDWVTVNSGDDSEMTVQRTGKDIVIPAILDTNNKHYLLCIKQATKTGYRIAFPLCPEGHNWVEEFNLLQPLNLPDIKDPLRLKGSNKAGLVCTSNSCKWFRERNYGFTPHDLRHAFNHRGHQLGVNPKAIADSLGHSMKMNQSGYLRHMSTSVKHEGIIKAITQEQNKRSENELLKEENKALEAKNTGLKQEIEILKTKLKMYEAIERK